MIPKSFKQNYLVAFKINIIKYNSAEKPHDCPSNHKTMTYTNNDNNNNNILYTEALSVLLNQVAAPF